MSRFGRMDDDPERIVEQVAYDRGWAPEHDDWFFRRGPFNLGPEHRRCWIDEIEQLRTALSLARPSGHVIELACGTGLWTERLIQYEDSVTAVDASPELIALNQRRLRSGVVHYLVADLFDWQPNYYFDFVFFGFWLSHLTLTRFVSFLSMVARCFTLGGRVFFVDSRYQLDMTNPTSSTSEQDTSRSRRRLQDGREFEIVKIYYRPDELESHLSALGWIVCVLQKISSCMVLCLLTVSVGDR